MNDSLLYELIHTACQRLESSVRIYPPARQTDIAAWEQAHDVTLPEGYKSWLLRSDGLNIGCSSAELCPLAKIDDFDYREGEPELQGVYYIIGEYIGDGSLLVTNPQGVFYKLDHVSGLKQCEFAAFMEEWVMERLEEYLQEEEIIEVDYGKCHNFTYHISDEAKAALLKVLNSK